MAITLYPVKADFMAEITVVFLNDKFANNVCKALMIALCFSRSVTDNL
jgi:hypothetical protein